MMGDLTLGDLRAHLNDGKALADGSAKKTDRKRDGDMVDHLNQIKKEKHLMRMRKNNDEETAMELLRDLELRKEKELRAQIEKEEI
jgi:hypothetical protein